MLILDGQLVEKKTASIEVCDKGLLLGMGLFETMRLHNANIIALDKHWQRLENSAKVLGLRLPLTLEMLKKALNTLIHHFTLVNSGFRLTVTQGCGARGLQADFNAKSRYILDFFDLPLRQKSYQLCWSTIMANPSDPSASIKSLSYLSHAFVKREAGLRGFDDALQLNKDGFVTETSCANVFMIKNNKAFTPPLTDGVLAGVTRARIIEYCSLNKIECMEKSLSKAEFVNADELFLCNALRGIVPISRIEHNDFIHFDMTQKLIKSMV